MEFRTGIDMGSKTGVLTLRLMLIIATALLVLPPGGSSSVSIFGSIMVIFFLVSNIALLPVPASRLLDRRTDFLLVVSDTFLVALGLFFANNGRPELPVAFFLILLLSATGPGQPRTAIATTIVAGSYLFLTHRAGLDAGMPATQSLLRIPFLFITGLYYGSAVVRIREEQERATHLETERKDLENFLAITAATTASLNLRTVLNSIVQKVARMVDATRCSFILIKDMGRQCIVMASNDNLEMEPLRLDLRKYPELRRAIETHETVVINDVGKEPMMSKVRGVLEQKNFLAILVVPVTFEKEMLGMLFVRAPHPRKCFSTSEIKACQVVANASATALKNAILFETVQDEAKRRKATSEILRNIMEHFPDLVFMADLQGSLTDLNRGAEELLGIKRDQVLGTPATDLFVGGDLPFDRAKLLQQGGSVSSHQVLLRRADGELRHGIAALALLRDEAGEPTGMVGVCKDITDLKNAQRQLQQAQTSSTIDRIAELAHKLNNPLTRVFGSAQFLMGANHDPKTVQESEKILESAMECQKIVQKLLNFSSQHPVEAD